MLFRKKRNAQKNEPDKPIGYVDEMGRITVRVRWDAPKTRPPKRVPDDATPRTR